MFVSSYCIPYMESLRSKGHGRSSSEHTNIVNDNTYSGSRNCWLNLVNLKEEERRTT